MPMPRGSCTGGTAQPIFEHLPLAPSNVHSYSVFSSAIGKAVWQLVNDITDTYALGASNKESITHHNLLLMLALRNATMAKRKQIQKCFHFTVYLNIIYTLPVDIQLQVPLETRLLG